VDKFILGFFSFAWLRGLDFLAPLAFRLYLAPMFWVSGAEKLGLFKGDVVWWQPATWFSGDAIQAASTKFDGGIFEGFTANAITVSVAGVEIIAAILLILGFAVRWITLPLMFVVAIVAMAALGEQPLLQTMQQFIMQHGYTTLANNMFEVAFVHFIMLFALFFMGAGRFLSLDWFIGHGYNRKIQAKEARKNAVNDDDEFDIDMMDDDNDVAAAKK